MRKPSKLQRKRKRKKELGRTCTEGSDKGRGGNGPKWNWTYQFQVKDQIGSFFYFPSLNFQRASGGYGGFIINNRDIIPIPFGTTDGDITIMIGDWYTRNHTALRKALDAGKDLGMPDGVLINGKGPYRYNDMLVPDGIEYETIEVHPDMDIPREFQNNTLAGLLSISSRFLPTVLNLLRRLAEEAQGHAAPEAPRPPYSSAS